MLTRQSTVFSRTTERSDGAKALAKLGGGGDLAKKLKAASHHGGTSALAKALGRPLRPKASPKKKAATTHKKKKTTHKKKKKTTHKKKGKR